MVRIIPFGHQLDKSTICVIASLGFFLFFHIYIYTYICSVGVRLALVVSLSSFLLSTIDHPILQYQLH